MIHHRHSSIFALLLLILLVLETATGQRAAVGLGAKLKNKWRKQSSGRSNNQNGDASSIVQGEQPKLWWKFYSSIPKDDPQSGNTVMLVTTLLVLGLSCYYYCNVTIGGGSTRLSSEEEGECRRLF